MLSYIETIKIALIVFPMIAFIITIPYVLIQYHKYGSVYFYRTIIIYSFILYLLIAYFLVILPLPTREEVALLTTPRYQLIPFSFIADIIMKSPLNLNDLSTIITTLKSQVFLQAFFNILLCIPFGAYLHYYFKCNLKKTILSTFCLSLFFELTQLSGLYFIYPRGYRLFDIDDLMLNTFGGMIGYFLGSIILKILPNRDTIDSKALEMGTKVTFWKRSISFTMDIIIFHAIYGIFFSLISLIYTNEWINKGLYIFLFFMYYFIRPLNNNYKTYAHQFLNLQLANIEKNKPLKWWQILLYYWYFYFFNFVIFFFWMNLLNYIYHKSLINNNHFVLLLTISAIIYLVYWIIYAIKRIKGDLLFYEKLSGVTLKSTIQKSSNSKNAE